MTHIFYETMALALVIGICGRKIAWYVCDFSAWFLTEYVIERRAKER